MVAFVLASELSRQFGGDTVGDLVSSLKTYRARVDSRVNE
jgi:hypothetical protein